MSYIDDIEQYLIGKGQKVKGRVQAEKGEGLKGGVSSIKGSINEGIAKLKMRNKTRRRAL